MKTKKYRLLLFDFDGTLVDTAPDIAHYANRVLEERGYAPKPLQAVKGAVGSGVHELLRTLEPDLGRDAGALDAAVGDFKKYYWERPVVHTKPFEGVLEMLTGPLRAVKKAIVTNKPQFLTEKILRELSMERYFDEVIGLDHGFPAKPDPAGVRHLMQVLGARPVETLLIGDSRIDAMTCRAASIDFAWVSYGYDTAEGYRPLKDYGRPGEWSDLVS